MPVLEAGQMFERYRIIHWLGSGVSGESYEAEDMMLHRTVTLKLIHPWSILPDSARRQFFREMQSISVLNTASLAPILDYGEIDGRLYVARHYIPSGSLLSNEGRSWFRPPLPIVDAISYCHQLAQALQYIHDSNYLHGGLTFSNIMVVHGPNLDNEPGYAPFLLVDVGLANFVRRFGQPQISLLPVTAAPEQLERRTVPASDQFALAVLLYFWLSGRPPYLGTPEEVEYQKITHTLTPISSLNPAVTLELEAVVQRALSVYPEKRYPSVLAFISALLAASTTRPVAVPEITLQEEASDRAEPTQVIADDVTPVTEPESPLPSMATPVDDVEASIPSEIQSAPLTTPLPSVESTPFPESLPDSEPGLLLQTEVDNDDRRSDIYDEPTSVMEAASLDTVKHEARPSFEVEPPTHPEPIEPQTPQEPETQPLPAPDVPQPDDPSTHPQQPEPETPQPLEPATLPEPTPQNVPDVPQPLPEPEVPEPLPEPAPQPAPQRETPQPTPDPIPQPAPDIPQPLPQPEIPQIEPQISPQIEPYAEEALPVGQTSQGPSWNPPALESAISPRFIIVSPYQDEPYEVLLKQGETTIGRAGSSGILLDKDNLTSRHHALLKYEGNHYIIYDQGSANGVFVNGQKLARGAGYALLDGDHISIGNYELIFRFRTPESIENAEVMSISPA